MLLTFSTSAASVALFTLLTSSTLVAGQASETLTSSDGFGAASTTVSTSDTSATATPSATSQIFTHTVSVAFAGFTFSPDVTLADVGDIIEFDFYPTNHSVARAEWGYPCIPYEDTGVDKVGFFSGFEPVDAILPNPPKFSIRVNDTNPIFYYCTAPGSCISYGMVGVINPNASTPLSIQKQKAYDSTFMLQPGEPWPSESQDPFTTSSSVSPVFYTSTKYSSSISSATATSSTSTATATSSAAGSNSSGHSSLSTGAIAGIAIGAAALVLIAAVLLYLCGRQSARTRRNDSPESYVKSPMEYSHPKHMSTVTATTGLLSPALPGYVPQHDPALSPPPAHAFPTSDAFGATTRSPSSPSFNPSGISNSNTPAPAYHQENPYLQSPRPQSHVNAPPNMQEMDAEQQAPRPRSDGILDFIVRQNNKGGVERYE